MQQQQQPWGQVPGLQPLGVQQGLPGGLPQIPGYGFGGISHTGIGQTPGLGMLGGIGVPERKHRSLACPHCLSCASRAGRRLDPLQELFESRDVEDRPRDDELGQRLGRARVRGRLEGAGFSVLRAPGTWADEEQAMFQFCERSSADGVVFAGAWWFPGAVHEGHGIARVAVDERATPEQRTAIVNIMTGKDGGMPWEIFASVTETFLDPLFAPIQFEIDRERRIARLSVPGLGEFRAEPIRNPVTGEEHRAIIKLPNGFEYKEAEMANAVAMQATLGDKSLRNQNSYTQLCAVEWSNG